MLSASTHQAILGIALISVPIILMLLVSIKHMGLSGTFAFFAKFILVIGGLISFLIGVFVALGAFHR